MRVAAILQSPGNEPVEQVWANHADDAVAIASVAQLLTHAKSEEPWAPRILSITITL